MKSHDALLGWVLHQVLAAAGSDLTLCYQPYFNHELVFRVWTLNLACPKLIPAIVAPTALQCVSSTSKQTSIL